MTEQQTKKFIYSQGLANLRLEGLSLSKEQNRLAQDYQDGRLSKSELIKEALKYAQS